MYINAMDTKTLGLEVKVMCMSKVRKVKLSVLLKITNVLTRYFDRMGKWADELGEYDSRNHMWMLREDGKDAIDSLTADIKFVSGMYNLSKFMIGIELRKMFRKRLSS